MNWIPTLTPSWLNGLLAAIPIGIVLLYFLKLRREPVEVPSTYLWMRTVEDLHVNSLLQRLRKSMLLLLQLLAVGLAALALFRPGFRGTSSGEDRFVFLLDTSASMNATDDDSGNSRFAIAKQRIGDRIESMSDTDTAMLVTFSDRAEVLQSFTTDRSRLRAALARAKPTNRTTDILGALKAADGLANPRRSSQVGDVNDVQVADAMPAELLLFSDGGFPPVTEFDLGNLVPRYEAVGTDQVANLSVVAFSAERNIETPSEIQAFATVANTGTVAAQSSVSLIVNDELADAAAVDLPPGERTGLSFTLNDEDAIALKLVIDEPDDLATDGVAFAGLRPLKTVSILVVTPGNQPLEIGLNTAKAGKICLTEFVDPDFLGTDDYRKRMLAGIDDLVIYDRCSPEKMPATNTFFVGALPSQDWAWDSDPSQVVLVDVDRSHPLMRFVDLYSLLIFQGRSVSGPTGSTELVGGDTGSVLGMANRDGFQDLVLGFEVVSQDENGNNEANTNWYAERSWPVFLLNVLRHLAGAAEATGAPSYRPGETVRLRMESVVDEVTIEQASDDSVVSGSDATDWTAKPSSNGFVEIVQTDVPGNYTIESDGRAVDLFAVNLFSVVESQLAVAPTVEIGYDEFTGVNAGIEKRQEYWRYLLIAMLGLIAVEWWYYGKRIT